MIFGTEAVRRHKEQQQEPRRQLSALELIPDDAPADDSTLTAWDGKRWRDIKWWTVERAFAIARGETRA